MSSPNDDWQLNRQMTPNQYKQTCKVLRLSRAASARYLDYDERTAYRWARGTAAIPVACILLLRNLIANDIKPIVPKRKN